MNRLQHIAADALAELVESFRAEAERWTEPDRTLILLEADGLAEVRKSTIMDALDDVSAFRYLDEARDHLATYVLRRCVTDDEARSFIKRLIGIEP